MPAAPNVFYDVLKTGVGKLLWHCEQTWVKNKGGVCTFWHFIDFNTPDKLRQSLERYLNPKQLHILPTVFMNKDRIGCAMPDQGSEVVSPWPLDYCSVRLYFRLRPLISAQANKRLAEEQVRPYLSTLMAVTCNNRAVNIRYLMHEMLH